MNRIRRLTTAGAVIALLIGAGFGMRTLLVLGEAETAAAGGEAVRSVPVITATAKQMEFIRGISVVGDVRAIDYALVSARVPGTLDEILVDEGDLVVAGQTVLFRTDSVALAREVEVAHHGQDVAKASTREALANLKRLTVLHSQAETDVERYRRLHQKGAATLHQLELAETKFREAEATLDHAQAVIDLARARQSQAASRLGIVEKSLADTIVLAPISGRVVERLREPGEMAGAGEPVLRIEDLERLEVTAYLPEECYAEVHTDATEVRARAGGASLGRMVVTFRGPIIDSKFRNFEMKATIPEPLPGVVPGRLVDLTVVLEARQGLGVPRTAVLERGGKSVVYTVENGKARAVEIRPGLATNGLVEFPGDALKPGAPIVVEGQDWLEDGSPVNRVEAK